MCMFAICKQGSLLYLLSSPDLPRRRKIDESLADLGRDHLCDTLRAYAGGYSNSQKSGDCVDVNGKQVLWTAQGNATCPTPGSFCVPLPSGTNCVTCLSNAVNCNGTQCAYCVYQDNRTATSLCTGGGSLSCTYCP